MNTDIRLSVTFPTHPKTVKLGKKLGPQGPLSLIYLFLFAAQHRPDGVLSGMDDEDISIAAQWPKEPKHFVDNLLAVRFIKKENGVYFINDWNVHNPYAVHAPERSEKAKKAAEKRWGKADAKTCNEQCSEHNQAMPLASISNAQSESSNAPSPAPSPNPFPSPNPKPNPNHKTTSAKDGKQPVDNSPREPVIENPALSEKEETQKPKTPEPDPEPEINFSDFDPPPTKPDKSAMLNGLKKIVDDCSKFYDASGVRQIMLFVESNISSRHPDAIKKCLDSLMHQLRQGEKIIKPKAYLEAALKIEDGVYNARDSENRCNEFKKPLPGGVETLGKVLQGIGRGNRS